MAASKHGGTTALSVSALSMMLAVTAGSLTLGCSWSRFDDVESNAPVVLLKKPDKLGAGFGVTMATASLEGKASRVLIGGATGENPAATFDLGVGTDPTTDAADTGSCNQDDPCYLAGGVAGIGHANVGGGQQRDLCFILGAGQTVHAQYGLIGRCEDGTVYTLPVPPDVEQKVIQDELILQKESANAPIRMATDRDESAGLVAGAPVQKLAWYYRPGSIAAVPLVAPGAVDDGFGSASAVVRLGGGGPSGGSLSRVVAVGAPDAGHVWLFDGGAAAGTPLGCFGGPSNFGMTLASGRVDEDDIDDLVIADDVNVTVISGKALALLRPASSITCSLAALPPSSIIASFSCATRDTVAGCAPGFAATLAVGDLDGDGDGEVLVGAPALSVRGKGSAGAVLVYDAEGPHDELLADMMFLSSGQAQDGLGSSLVAAHLKGRDVVVAGAPGSARAAVFYCSNVLGGAASASGRCQ